MSMNNTFEKIIFEKIIYTFEKLYKKKYMNIWIV